MSKMFVYLQKESEMKQIKLEKETVKIIGIYLIDTSKLIFGGVILTAIMGLTESKALLLLYGILSVVVTGFTGIALINKINKKN